MDTGDRVKIRIMITLPMLAIALSVFVAAPVAAQTQKPSGVRPATRNQQIQRAKERCQQNHGVDCDTPEGLQEWVLQERSREEAVKEGSRHRLPAQNGRAPGRR